MKPQVNMKKFPFRGTYSEVARKMNVHRVTVQQGYENDHPKYIAAVDKEINRRRAKAERMFGKLPAGEGGKRK